MRTFLHNTDRTPVALSLRERVGVRAARNVSPTGTIEPEVPEDLQAKSLSPSGQPSPRPSPGGRGRSAYGLLGTIFALTLWIISGCTPPVPAPVVPKPIAPVKPTSVKAEAIPNVKFVDITKAAGIAFVHTSGAT